MEVRLLPKDASLIAMIDRSEHVDVQYGVVDGQLTEQPVVMPEIPTWDPVGSGEHSVGALVEFCASAIVDGAVLLGVFEEDLPTGLAVVDASFEARLAWLTFLHVSRPHRRRGVASALWAYLDANSLNSTILNEQCFRYEYDAKGKKTMKKVPGAGEVYMIYDTRDRPSFTQDANMRSNNQWLATLFDGLNRPVMTGLMTYNISLGNLQDTVGNLTSTPANPQTDIKVDLVLSGTHSGDKRALRSITMNDEFETTTNSEFSSEITTSVGGEDGETKVISGMAINKNPIPSAATFNPLTITFYDNYEWRQHHNNPLADSRNTSYDSHLLTASNNTYPYPQSVLQSNMLKGLVTGTAVKNLGTGAFLYNVSFYDEKARVIQTQSTNITGESDITSMQYSFANEPLIIINKTAKAGNNTKTTISVTKLSYDDLGRLVSTEKKLSNSLVNSGTMSEWVLLSEHKHDALGQLKKKILSPDAIDSLVYDYNIRGWMFGANRAYVKDPNNT